MARLRSIKISQPWQPELLDASLQTPVVRKYPFYTIDRMDMIIFCYNAEVLAQQWNRRSQTSLSNVITKEKGCGEGAFIREKKKEISKIEN